MGKAMSIKANLEQIDPKDALKDLKSLFQSMDYKKKKGAELKTDEDWVNHIRDCLIDMGENMSTMARMVSATKNVKLMHTMQKALAMSSMMAHEYMMLCGTDPDDIDEDGEEHHLAMWRLPIEDEDCYPTVAWMMNMMAESFIMQAFPVKDNKEFYSALYSFFIHLAAAVASACAEEEMYNCDWVNILENSDFMRRSADGEFVMKGVNCREGLPGNKQAEELLNKRWEEQHAKK